MDRPSDGHDSHWPPALGDDEDMMGFLASWGISQVPGAVMDQFNLHDTSFLDQGAQPQNPTISHNPLHPHPHPTASLPMNIVPPALDTPSNTVSGSQKRPVLDEQAALRQNRLEKWHLNPEGRPTMLASAEQEANEDGNASCKSSPSQGSCPSHCGKPGQGSVCCNDDDCGAAGTVCSDEECDGAMNPCDDEDCMADICSQTFTGLGGEAEADDFVMLGLETGGQHRKQADEVAAAAALTSFADNPPNLQPVGNLRRRSYIPTPDDSSYFDAFPTSFHQSPSSSFSNSQGNVFTNTHGSPFGNTYNHTFPDTHGFNSSCSSPPGFGNSHMLLSPHSTGNHMLQHQQFPDKNYLAYTSHVLNYHNSLANTAGHHKPCFVNNATLPTSCPLPTYQNPQSLGMDHSMKANNLYSACGFNIQDPQAFQQHILSEHHDLKSALPLTAPCDLDWSVNNQFSPTDSQSNIWNFQQDSGVSFNQFQTRQMPSSAHSLNNASVTQPFLPTPALSTLQGVKTEMQAKTEQVAASRRQSSNFDPEELMDSLEPSLADLTELSPSLAEQPKHPCQCLWLDEKTDQACNKWFDCAKALDDHCRRDHVKPLEKKEGGFRCRWQMCPRRNKDNFPQRGKLNRHLQVHTGLKPNVCPYCGLAVSAKQALDQHVRLHTQETPYPCTWEGCNQKFKQRSALTMHYRTHTGEKPLLCDICGLHFRESSNLTKHRRTHDSKGMYECDICNRDFNRLDQLRRHLNSNHKDSPERVEEVLKKLKPNSRQAPLQVRRNTIAQKKAALRVTTPAELKGGGDQAIVTPGAEFVNIKP